MSPIERKLYDALVCTVPDSLEVSDLVDDVTIGTRGGEYAVLEAQVPIASYFADLCLTTNGGMRLVIECDGHDFHNVTKQQAAYDRARDRELLAMGIQTIRFTGSEIHHSAEKCAREAWNIFSKVIETENAPISAWQLGHDMALSKGVGAERTRKAGI